MVKQNQKDQYKPSEIEQKWQERWDKSGVYKPNLDTAKNPYFNLMMFPYPSAEGMHVGNMYAFTGSDIHGRYKRMQGNSVFEPIGLDGFGIHSENYAIKVGRHPKEQAQISEKNFYRQLRATGNGFDWTRTVETYDSEYYKWTQWIFVQLFKAGLAYRKKSPVNFCPSCKTVLADEQVIDGKCERCGSLVEKRDLEQWFFKITSYAERLLQGLDKIDWTEKVKIAQRQWIGKSEGAYITFRVYNPPSGTDSNISVFTTRPDTIHGATFLVLAPEHPLIDRFLSKEFQGRDIHREEMRKYQKQVKSTSEQDRIAETKEKTGVFTGMYARNPASGEKIPIWIADYVLMGYGTGAIMAVPAHDQRDFLFAKKYKLAIKKVITPLDKKVELTEAYIGLGRIVNSDKLNGLETPREMSKVLDWLFSNQLGVTQTTYHLRDWLISRQRYWGPPIPMIFCKNCAEKGDSWFTSKEFEKSVENHTHASLIEECCPGFFGRLDMPGWYSVPEKDLPVHLPDVKDWKPKGSGESPLALIPEFVNTTCPKCGGKARRETDVSDTFLDSSWYFFRYISTEFHDRAFDNARVKKWLPVSMYIGGAEHSVLHLLYTRFLTMVFHDLKLIDFEEPFPRFYAHGLLIKEGAKMSKSKGNVVVPDEYIKKFGADTLRSYLMFTGPFNMGGDFQDAGIEGMHRFLKRVWTLVTKTHKTDGQMSKEANIMMHKTTKRVTDDMESLRYNTAIAALMEYYNFLSRQETVAIEEKKVLLQLLAPLAPHITEELWEKVGGAYSIHNQGWPSYDKSALQEEEVTIVVQVNGRVRETIRVESGKLKVQNQKEIEQMAKESAKVQKYLADKQIEKVVYVEGKLINFVT